MASRLPDFILADTLPSAEARDRVLDDLKARGILGVFHYVPLHSAPAGRRYGRVSGTMKVTDDVSRRLVRLPLWVGMTATDVDEVAETVLRSLG